MLSQGGRGNPGHSLNGSAGARMVNGGYSVSELQTAMIAGHGGFSCGRDGGASTTLDADAKGPFFYVRGAGKHGEQHE